MTNFLPDILKDTPNTFKPVSFWFLNHYPEREELRRQIHEMHQKGFGGLMLHARDGLLGGYLNRHWEETVRWILEEAESLGLLVYLYDELHYPSGPAGGLLFESRPESAMQYLELVLEQEILPCGTVEGEYEKLLAIHSDGRVESLVGPWKNEGKTSVHVLGFQIRKSLEYPDYLDAEDMKEFVRLSYHWYAEQFGRYFGKNHCRGVHRQQLREFRVLPPFDPLDRLL